MRILILILMFLNLNLLYASSPGSKALSFLKIDTGARPSSMAGAYVSYGDDAFSIFYNPALSSKLSKHRVDLMHFEYFEDINYENASAVFKVNDKYSAGIGFSYLYMTGISRTVRADNMDGYSTDGSFGSSDLMVVLCNSLQVNKNINIGVNIKYIKESIDKETASTFCGDLGFLSKLSLPLDPDFGISVCNIGLPIKYIDKKEDIPMLVKAGLSSSFNFIKLNAKEKKDLNISFNAEKPVDNDLNLRLGVEMWFIDMIAFRTGYKLSFNNDDLGGVTFGAGLDINRFSLSYAFVPYRYVNNTHRFSAGIKF